MNDGDIRDVLREIIAERGYKQATIAQRAGLTPAKFSNVLNKTRQLEVHEFIRICNAMHLQPELIMQTASPQRQTTAAGYASGNY